MLHIDINIVTIIHNNVTYSYIKAIIIIYYSILTLLHMMGIEIIGAQTQDASPKQD